MGNNKAVHLVEIDSNKVKNPDHKDKMVLIYTWVNAANKNETTLYYLDKADLEKNIRNR